MFRLPGRRTSNECHLLSRGLDPHHRRGKSEERREKFRLRIQEQDDHDRTKEDPRAIRTLEQELNPLLQEENGVPDHSNVSCPAHEIAGLQEALSKLRFNYKYDKRATHWLSSPQQSAGLIDRELRCWSEVPDHRTTGIIKTKDRFKISENVLRDIN